MRFAAPLLTLLLGLTVLAGCGSSGGTSSGTGTGPGASSSTAPAGASAHACALDVDGIEGLRVTSVSCGEAQRVAASWRRSPQCGKQGSRSGCSVRSYRCVATATDRGWSVSCAKKGAAIAFTVRRG